ncbi:MAG: DNA-processing protein DprA [Pseudomonadota bacterium]
MTAYAELYYWLAAANLKGLGAVTIRRGLEYFASIKNLFHATAAELQVAGFSASAINIIQSANLSAQDTILQWCEQAQCHLITFNDPAYPTLLKEISDAPLVLYVRGDVAALNKPQIAMVGTRNPTHAGRECAEQFAGALAQAGLIITSGLAAGIDAASHTGALAVPAPTIAVLGTGLAHVYPAENRKLANEIAEKGALVSEFPPQMKPIAMNFPRRNRIISGLSLGVIVVEATLHSGSLITARFAAEQGREVFALPGSIHNPLSRGCHQLIRQGAKLIETAADIIEELSALHQAMLFPATKNTSTNPCILDKKHQELLNFVGYEPTSVDTLVTRSGLTVSQVSSMLLSLELQSYVNFTPGGYVRFSANSR